MAYGKFRGRNVTRSGGIPHDSILQKLESTDPMLVGGVHGRYGDNDYEYYARQEIVDRSIEKPFLASDQARRNPSASRAALNLRYNGTRGTNIEGPRHPDLFIGFTGNDSRNLSNDPNLADVRAQMKSRVGDLTVNMGDNDENQINETPWAHHDLSRAKKDVHRRLKKETKIFSSQKGSQVRHDNFATNEYTTANLRRVILPEGSESMSMRGGVSRFTDGDYGSAHDSTTDGVRGVDAGHFSGTELSHWRYTTGGEILGVQKYGQSRSGGRQLIGTGAVGGGRLKDAATEQSFANARTAQSTNRKNLAATMAVAARHRHAVKSGKHGHDYAETFASGVIGGKLMPGHARAINDVTGDQAYNAEMVVDGMPGANLSPGDVTVALRESVEDQSRAAAIYSSNVYGANLTPLGDLTMVAHSTSEDQVRRRAEQVQDGDGGISIGAGLMPGANVERATRSSEAFTTPNSHITNVAAIVTGLREGTASSRRKIAGMIEASGIRTGPTSEAMLGLKQQLAPGGDAGKVMRMSKVSINNAAAAGDLVVHTYSAAAPKLHHRAAHARKSHSTNAWQSHRVTQRVGKQANREGRRSNTADPTVLGDTADEVFGLDAEVRQSNGSSAVGPKTLRSTAWASESGMTDEVREAF